MSGFDLTEAKEVADREDAGRVIHIKNEAGEPIYHGDEQPVTMTVVGTYSTRYRRALDAKRDKLVGRSDMEKIREDALDIAAQCVTAWDGFYEGGVPLECNRTNVAKVLRAAQWIRDQVDAAMDDHAGFSTALSRD